MKIATGTVFIRGLLVILAVGFVFFYTLYQARSLIEGPRTEITSPSDGARVLEPVVEVRGGSAHVARIFFNDSPIFIDDKGNFRELFALSKGYNIVKVSAEDRFGRKEEKMLHLILN